MRYQIVYTAVILCLLTFAEVASSEGLLSYTISKHTIDDSFNKGIEKAHGNNKVEDREIWLSPSLNIDMYVEEIQTHRSKQGIIPGVGFGIRWNPKFWVQIGSDLNSKSLLNLDVYVQGSMVDEIDNLSGNDYFAIDVLPAITLFDWFSIGYGYRWKRSQHDDLDNEETPLLSFGLRKSL